MQIYFDWLTGLTMVILTLRWPRRSLKYFKYLCAK
jgi:hypothetical protein